MEGSADFKQTAAIIINRIFALLYLLAALAIGYRAMNGEVNWIGSLAIIAFFGFQAVGHHQPYLWGPKVTAAVIGAINFGMIFYLLPGYEQNLVPSLGKRLINFVAITAVTILLIVNYISCDRLFGKRKQKSKRRPRQAKRGTTSK